MKTSKLLTLLLVAALALLVLSASIAAPILCRPFYYAQIEPLGLEEMSGLSKADIRTAYDEMMDFCLGMREEFSTGKLPFSAEGKSHFEDVRALFLLDLRVLTMSAVALVILWIGMRVLKIRPHRFLDRGAPFWAACGLGAFFAACGIACAIDFDWFFTMFHAVAFPGKTNWLFDPAYDAVILILPQEYFLGCCVMILALLLIGCAVLLVLGRKRREKK